MFVGIVDAFRSMIGAFSFDISPVSYDACLFFMILLPIYDTSMILLWLFSEKYHSYK